MSLKTILQAPVIIVALAAAAIALMILSGSDVLVGIVVVIPFMTCLWLVRRRYLLLIQQAVKDDLSQRRTLTYPNKEL